MSTYSYTLVSGVNNSLNIPSDVDLSGNTSLTIQVSDREDFAVVHTSYTATSQTAHGGVFVIPAADADLIGGYFYRLVYVLSGTTHYGTTGELLPPDKPNGYAKQADVDALTATVNALSGNTNQADSVTRAHLWDVPQITVAPNALVTPGLYYDSANNIAGIGNTIVEVYTIPGVVIQRVTGIDSGKVANRRQYGGTWSAWQIIVPSATA